jgi:PST family polysaccharide transporter
MKELYNKSTSALKWNVLDQGISQVIQFATNIILLRLIDPQIFGVFALPFLALSFVRTFQDLGMSNYMVKEKEIPKENLSAILGFILVSSLCFFLVSFFVMPYALRAWMDENTNLSVMRSLSIVIIIYGPSIFFESLLRKKLEFKHLYIINLIATIASCILAIFMAMKGQDLWSLVAKQLCYFGLFAVASYAFTIREERILPTFRFAKIKSAFSYSLDVSKEEMMNFIIKNVDSLLIGRYLGATQLGIYDRGLRLLTMPVQQLSGSLNKVLFPTLSQIAIDKEATRNAFSMAVQSIALLIMPSMLFLYFMAEEVVSMLFGSKWIQLIPLIKIFSLLAIVQSVTMLATNIFFVFNETKKMLRFSYWSKSLLLTGFLIGAVYFKDMITLAWIYLTISAITAIPYLNLVAKLLDTNVLHYFKAIAKYGFYALLAVLSIVILKNTFGSLIPNFMLLIISFSVISISYISILILTRDKIFKGLLSLITKQKLSNTKKRP